MLYLPKNAVDYPTFKTRLVRNLLIWALFSTLAVFLFYPAWVSHYVLGVGLGFGYLWSLFRTVEYPQKKLSQVFSMVRILCVSFLIVWGGQFKLLDTCIVFCGFLSYKVVLVLEYVRYSVGIKFYRGK